MEGQVHAQGAFPGDPVGHPAIDTFELQPPDRTDGAGLLAAGAVLVPGVRERNQHPAHNGRELSPQR